MKEEHKDGRDFDFLIGKSIVKVEYERLGNEYQYGQPMGYKLTCDDGTIIVIALNDGCVCGEGCSSFDDLAKLEENHNVITNVECEYSKDAYSGDKFTLFIYYADNTINQLQGDDGYGYGWYGGGFYVTIKEVKRTE